MVHGRADEVVVPTAEWLAGLSEQARARGDRDRADRLLLLAWQAYDGQAVALDGLWLDDAPLDGSGHRAAAPHDGDGCPPPSKVCSAG